MNTTHTHSRSSTSTTTTTMTTNSNATTTRTTATSRARHHAFQFASLVANAKTNEDLVSLEFTSNASSGGDDACERARRRVRAHGVEEAAIARARGAALCAGRVEREVDPEVDDVRSELTVCARGEWMVASHGAEASDVVRALEEACARANASDGENRGKTRASAVKRALGALIDAQAHGRGFAIIAFDQVCERGLAARYKTAPRVTYGHDANGALVLEMGDGARASDECAELCAGRFVFGHGYVKPMEFEDFWATARSTRAASPAKAAFDVEPRRRAPAARASDALSTPLRAASPNAYVPPAVRALRAAEEAERLAALAARRKSEALDAALAQTLHENQRMASALGDALANVLIKVASRASFASENAEISRFHAARFKAPIAVANVQSASSFYAPTISVPTVSEDLVRQSFEASCARLSMESRRASIESSRLSLSRAAC